MKKLVVFILIIISVFLTTFVKDKLNPLFACANVYEVCLVVDNNAITGDVIKCGNKDFVYLNKEEGLEKVKQCKVYSTQFYLKDISLFDILDLLEGYVVIEQEFSDLEIYYCYTAMEQDCVYIDNKKVNLQIVLRENDVVAGMPLILTGY